MIRHAMERPVFGWGGYRDDPGQSIPSQVSFKFAVSTAFGRSSLDKNGLVWRRTGVRVTYSRRSRYVLLRRRGREWGSPDARCTRSPQHQPADLHLRLPAQRDVQSDVRADCRRDFTTTAISCQASATAESAGPRSLGWKYRVPRVCDASTAPSLTPASLANQDIYSRMTEQTETPIRESPTPRRAWLC